MWELPGVSLNSKTHRSFTKFWLFVEISRAEFLFPWAIRQVWATKFSVKPGGCPGSRLWLWGEVVAVVTQIDKIKITMAKSCSKWIEGSHWMFPTSQLCFKMQCHMLIHVIWFVRTVKICSDILALVSSRRRFSSAIASLISRRSWEHYRVKSLWETNGSGEKKGQQTGHSSHDKRLNVDKVS